MAGTFFNVLLQPNLMCRKSIQKIFIFPGSWYTGSPLHSCTRVVKEEHYKCLKEEAHH
jgi:hypothetical protein